MTICGRKPRKIRCIIVLAIIVLLISALCGNFVAQADDSVDQQLKAVYVSSGDTLWGLVEKHCDYSGDIRKAIHSVRDINNIPDGNIYSGQIIYIPEAL